MVVRDIRSLTGCDRRRSADIKKALELGINRSKSVGYVVKFLRSYLCIKGLLFIARVIFSAPGRSFSAGKKKPPGGGLVVITAWRLLLNPAGGNLLDRGFDGVGIKRDYFVTGLLVEHFKVGHQRQNLIAPECLGSLLN